MSAPGRWSRAQAPGSAAGTPGRLRSLGVATWPLFQASLAASVAWSIALRVAGHPDPFFAPMSALVALNAPRGERGLQAVRLVVGVMLGIAIGEATATFLGAGFWKIGLAVFVAMGIAHAAGGTRLVVIQAGAGAILTVVAADGEAGVNRLIDAMIGGGVALLFSQVLFSPEPVQLLRRAEKAALVGIADGLTLGARALEDDDPAQADRALASLREVRDSLGELARMRKASHNVARRSAIWRSQRAPVVRERENADHLDLLGGAAVMLARTLVERDLADRDLLAAAVRELAAAVCLLAQAPGDRETRQQAADRALAVARSLRDADPPRGSSTALAVDMLRIVTTDIMVFAGIEAERAVDAVRQETADFQVPHPPATPRSPFELVRWRSGGRPDSAGELPRRQSDPPHGDAEE